jgi:hypothetical protein
VLSRINKKIEKAGQQRCETRYYQSLWTLEENLLVGTVISPAGTASQIDGPIRKLYLVRRFLNLAPGSGGQMRNSLRGAS